VASILFSAAAGGCHVGVTLPPGPAAAGSPLNSSYPHRGPRCAVVWIIVSLPPPAMTLAQWYGQPRQASAAVRLSCGLGPRAHELPGAAASDSPTAAVLFACGQCCQHERRRWWGSCLRCTCR